jgi:arabinofuranan 3-O-arabinosyltransferase
VMAPIAGIDNPQLAYRIWQLTMLGCMFAAGWGVRVLTDGRWWWSVATMLLMSFSGARAGLDLGQNAALTMMLVVFGWALRVRQRPVLAGIVWGLLAFKPVWALSFFGALVFLRQWRMLTAMGATGLTLIIATLPVVGIETWKHWIEVGKIASETYNTDRNWIFLSRDLFGIPRRFLLEFNENGSATNNRPLLAKIGWAVWCVIFILTAFMANWRRLNESLLGPGPAFAFLAAWMLTYRFMYYDSQIACFAVFVLLAVPGKWMRFSSWPIVSWAVIWALMPVIHENFLVVQDFQFTIVWHRQDREVTFHLNDFYPCETFMMFLAWLWCMRTLWFGWETSFR